MLSHNLVQQVREMYYLEVFTTPLRTFHHLNLVLVQKTCHDADGIFIVDNRGLSRYDVVFEQEL